MQPGSIARLRGGEVRRKKRAIEDIAAVFD